MSNKADFMVFVNFVLFMQLATLLASGAVSLFLPVNMAIIVQANAISFIATLIAPAFCKVFDWWMSL